MVKMVVCSVLNLFVIMLHSQLVLSQLPDDQVSAMTSVYEILQNNTARPYFMWNDVLKTSNPCSWEGVDCTPDNSSITTLFFNSCSISTNEFLPFLCNISTLESLDVSDNPLSSIPHSFFTGCGKLSGLKSLKLRGNYLMDSLPSFKNGFRVLEELDFSGNYLSGEIGLQLEGLDSLKILNLGWNEFSGKIPTNLGKWNLLEELVLSGNLFRGEIPLEITKFKNLSLIDLSGNQLSGSLPRKFGEFTRLQSLNLSLNSLSGEIPTSISNITTLESFTAYRNMFNGTIPLGITSNLAHLDLSNNRLSGEIPSDLGLCKNLSVLNLANNRLRGIIPSDLLSGPNLVHLDLSFNTLEGPIPPITSNSLNGTIPSHPLGSYPGLTVLALGNNRLSGEIPSDLGLCKNLSVLNLANNSLRGIIPSDLLSGPNLVHLNLSFNTLEGPIPPITSNSLNGTIPSHPLGSYPGLTVLELGNNRLSGEIPSDLGLCKNLSVLNMANNILRGTLPPSLGNLTNLQDLNLESNNLVGEIPPQISQLSSLYTLNLRRNSLTGSIPTSISRMRSLQSLDLQGNKLGGSIPRSIEFLSLLMELQLGSNQLNGRIPLMPESMVTANLSHNLFEGPIPSSLSSLRFNLRVLDLSNNRFSGEIPSFLAELICLTHLLLMNNNLYGVVPTFGGGVKVETRPGNSQLMYDYDRPAVVPHRKTKLVDSSDVAVSVASGFPVGISVIAIFISTRYKTIHHHLSPPNSILRSAIDIKKGMEAVSDLSNVSHEARFSTFYKAVMPSGSTYLVKKINRSYNILKFPRIREVSEELEILGNLSHPNVMIPKAYVLTPRRAYLFYDFARGTLHDVLHRRTGNVTLDWASRYSIAVGVAKGLAYLHECSSGPILLLDLCTKSVLLKSLDEPQISDVELCNFIHPSSGTSLFSDGYAPPEYGSGERATAAWNVYSYGVLLLELLTGKPAVSDEGAELAEWALTFSDRKSQRDQILDSSVGETSVGVRSQMLAAVEVALACVSVSPEKRPNAVTVLQMLQSKQIIGHQRL